MQVYDDMVADKDDKLDARKKDFDPSSGRERKDSRYIAQLKKSAEIRKVFLQIYASLLQRNSGTFLLIHHICIIMTTECTQHLTLLCAYAVNRLLPGLHVYYIRWMTSASFN
jgi:hypothetical protein